MISINKISLFFCGLIIVSLVFSPFLLTVSMIGLLILGLVKENKEGLNRFSFNKNLGTKLMDWKSNAAFLVIPFYFFIVLFGIWQVEGDYTYLLERLRIKLPFIALPIAFLGLPHFEHRQIKGLLYFLLIFITLTGIGISTNYLLNYDLINDMLSRGKPMPTPRNHIRYSLLVGVSIIGGIYLIKEKYFYKNPRERYLIIILTIFLFLFIHILSVKSGILCLYIALGVLSLQFIYLSKKYLFGFLIITGLISLPVIAFVTIPSFQHKLTYMHYDLKKYFAGEGEQYSDSGRLTSLKVGWNLFVNAPVFGVGAGNIKKEVHQFYEQKYPDYVKPILPHDQFLFVLAGSGLFGFFFFGLAVFVPLFYHKNYRHFFFLGLYTIFLVALVLEHTLENAEGVGIFSFFIGLFLNHLHKSPHKFVKNRPIV